MEHLDHPFPHFNDAKMARFLLLWAFIIAFGGWGIIVPFYTVQDCSSASGQDKPNRALWLATRAGKMEPSCPLGTSRCIPLAKFTKSHTINPLLTKFVRSRWLDIGLVLFFCEFMDLDFVSVHKHAKKELGQYPAILTSHLVNNPYIWKLKLGTLWAPT